MVKPTILRRIPVLLFYLLGYFSNPLFAQDTDRLRPTFHESRREALRSHLSPHSVAIVFANPVRNRSNDVDYQYSPAPDIYYLSGCTEPGAALFIFSDSIEIAGTYTNELLIIQGYDSVKAVWTGKTMTADEAVRVTGVRVVKKADELPGLLAPLCAFSNILVQYPKGSSADTTTEEIVFPVKQWINRCYKNSDQKGLTTLLAGLREMKSVDELELMQKAIDVSISGFKEMMRIVKPGLYEYQAQALFEYVSKRGGAEYMGYPSIGGSGVNSCVLHYINNRKMMQDGELFLADMGAEYHGYTADITRTMPVNGKFTADQLLIYNLVYDAQQAGFAACKPGASFRATYNASKDVIARGLINLGIIHSEGDYRRYFMHGTSHYLGLDVHDAGLYCPLKPGTVITVEPGIYIPPGSPCDSKWWGIGIRIEDDVLITGDGYRILTGALPRAAAEVEKMMQVPENETGR